jgi:hypothetical protein
MKYNFLANLVKNFLSFLHNSAILLLVLKILTQNQYNEKNI